MKIEMETYSIEVLKNAKVTSTYVGIDRAESSLDKTRRIEKIEIDIKVEGYDKVWGWDITDRDALDPLIYLTNDDEYLVDAESVEDYAHNTLAEFLDTFTGCLVTLEDLKDLEKKGYIKINHD